MRALLVLALLAAASGLAAAHGHTDELPALGSVALTFDVAGEAAYYCEPHPQMVGMVRVVEGRAASNDTVVPVRNLKYEPQEVEVGVGSTVTWQNEDDMRHTVTVRSSYRSGGADAPAAGAAAVALVAVAVGLIAARRV